MWSNISYNHLKWISRHQVKTSFLFSTTASFARHKRPNHGAARDLNTTMKLQVAGRERSSQSRRSKNQAGLRHIDVTFMCSRLYIYIEVYMQMNESYFASNINYIHTVCSFIAHNDASLQEMGIVRWYGLAICLFLSHNALYDFEDFQFIVFHLL